MTCKRNQCKNKGCNWIVKNKGDECVPCKSDKRCHMPTPKPTPRTKKSLKYYDEGEMEFNYENFQY